VLPDDNAMNWRKLAIGSGSIGVTTADSDVSGAMENMIARLHCLIAHRWRRPVGSAEPMTELLSRLLPERQRHIISAERQEQ
jgi:hypothetical protein